MKARSPWLWVPALYFAEGLPYFIVNTISVVILKDLGMDNSRLALLTSLIGLPWLIKPLWSPFVDIFRSKRWWIVTMQLLMAAAVALLAITLPVSSPFTWTLILFVITGFASASHDIAADGFYMIGLNEGHQSAFVGIRNTFYRIAMVFGQGVLVVLAGWLEKRTGAVSRSWSITLLITAAILAAVTLYHAFVLPRPDEDLSAGRKTVREIFAEFGEAFRSFFTKPASACWCSSCCCTVCRKRCPSSFYIPSSVTRRPLGGWDWTRKHTGWCTERPVLSPSLRGVSSEVGTSRAGAFAAAFCRWRSASRSRVPFTCSWRSSVLLPCGR